MLHFQPLYSTFLHFTARQGRFRPRNVFSGRSTANCWFQKGGEKRLNRGVSFVCGPREPLPQASDDRTARVLGAAKSKSIVAFLCWDYCKNRSNEGIACRGTRPAILGLTTIR